VNAALDPRIDRSATKPARTNRCNSRIFAHSRLDSLLLVMTGVQFAVLEFACWTCGTVSWGVTLGLGVLTLFLILTNSECVAHNFIHTPFFCSPRWNMAFGVFNSLLLGHPQTIYRLQHLQHHKYNNDLPDPHTGTTKDFTSTWRYGTPPTREENILTYALLSYFRTDYKLLWREIRRRRLTMNVLCEITAMVAAIVLLAIGNWRGLVFFYLPVWYLGTAAGMAQNYLEHYGATPGNRQTDSVSCYNPAYNFIWFNHGYHQEHHLRPQIHWTRIAEIRDLLPPESERRVVWGAHWFNFAPVRRKAAQ
jgi:fatty acid desaturase